MDEDAILEIFRAEPGRVLSQQEIIEKTNQTPGQLKTVRRLLKRLVKVGQLEQHHGRRYSITDPIKAVGDPVGTRRIGTLSVVGKAAYIEPETESGPGSHPILLIDKDAAELPHGVLIELEIVQAATMTSAAQARVVEVLGRPGERNVEIRGIIERNGLTADFPEEVVAEADAFGTEVAAADCANRKDLRHLPLVTIDGEDAKDFDDAICVERREDGSHTLYVAIADVSHYVTPKSELDREALRRGTSTYLTDRCIPMLPEQLSNNLCSLRPNVDRLCVVAEMHIDQQGVTRDSRFYRAVMRSQARLTYTQVSAALEGEPDTQTQPLLSMLLRANRIAGRLLANRLKRGAIDLDVAEPSVVFQDGFPVDAVPRARNDAHRLIEDLMLAANEAVAGYFEDRGVAAIYRIHESPDPERLTLFTELCARLGLTVKLKKRITPKDVAALTVQLSLLDSGSMFQSLLLRCMAQARYAAGNEGHFGLAAPRYTHFTSPIRRYPDLMVHRLLMAHLVGGASGYKRTMLEKIAEQSSERERQAMTAERATMDLDRAYVASAHVGERLPARITGIARFGMFATVNSPYVDGLIPIHTIGGDFWNSDEIGSVMRGQSSGLEFHLGDAITVEIARVDVQKRQVELRLIDERAAALETTGRPRQARRSRDEGSRRSAEPRKVGGGRKAEPRKRFKPKSAAGPRGGKAGGPRRGKAGGTKPKRSRKPKGRSRGRR